MFCPQCGANQSDDLKFCKSCGANLYAVRQVVATRETDEKFDWSKTWVAEMFLSDGERRRRKIEELERLRGTTSEIPLDGRTVTVWDVELEKLRGTTPEIQRSREIKAGVITGSVGIGLAIFLYVFMQGIILSGDVAPDAAEILRRLWVVGVIPLCIGIALVFNGLMVGRRLVRAADQDSTSRRILEREKDPHFPPSADTAGLVPPNFSVTEETTRQLRDPDPKER
jgi:hypothetical protein